MFKESGASSALLPGRLATGHFTALHCRWTAKLHNFHPGYLELYGSYGFSCRPLMDKLGHSFKRCKASLLNHHLALHDCPEGTTWFRLSFLTGFTLLCCHLFSHKLGLVSFLQWMYSTSPVVQWQSVALRSVGCQFSSLQGTDTVKIVSWVQYHR